MTYTLPNYNGEIIDEKTIDVALNEDNDLFKMIKSVITTIAYQELRMITETREIYPNLAEKYSTGYTLTDEDVNLLTFYFIPLHGIELRNYIQRLATRIVTEQQGTNATVSHRLANTIRSTLVYNGYLHFVIDNNELKIMKEGVAQNIKTEDILNSVSLMLQNPDFINKLQDEVNV